MTGFITRKLGRKRPLGAILKAARTKAELTLEEAEKRTKICAKYLIALEEGKYEELPAEAYNVGYVRAYAQALKLNQEKIVRLYREERSSQRLAAPSDQVRLSPRRASDWHFLITPKVLGILSMFIIFGGMVGYIFVQLSAFSKPPMITLGVPKEFTSKKDTVNLQGRTTEGSVVTMNGEPIDVKVDGQFSQIAQLSPGVNEFLIRSRNRAQRESQVSVKVLYDQGVAQAPQSVTKE